MSATCERLLTICEETKIYTFIQETAKTILDTKLSIDCMSICMYVTLRPPPWILKQDEMKISVKDHIPKIAKHNVYQFCFYGNNNSNQN